MNINQVSRLLEVLKNDERISNHFDMFSEETAEIFYNLSDKQIELLKSMYRYGLIRKKAHIGKSMYDLFIEWGIKPIGDKFYN